VIKACNLDPGTDGHQNVVVATEDINIRIGVKLVMERNIYRVAPNRLPEIEHFPSPARFPRKRVLNLPPNPLLFSAHFFSPICSCQAKMGQTSYLMGQTSYLTSEQISCFSSVGLALDSVGPKHK
jgi:hypothetical protein